MDPTPDTILLPNPWIPQLGTHLRGKRKREELASYMRKQQKKEAAEQKAAGHK
jgi:hypothetical protein